MLKTLLSGLAVIAAATFLLGVSGGRADALPALPTSAPHAVGQYHRLYRRPIVVRRRVLRPVRRPIVVRPAYRHARRHRNGLTIHL